MPPAALLATLFAPPLDARVALMLPRLLLDVMLLDAVVLLTDELHAALLTNVLHATLHDCLSPA